MEPKPKSITLDEVEPRLEPVSPDEMVAIIREELGVTGGKVHRLKKELKFWTEETDCGEEALDGLDVAEAAFTQTEKIAERLGVIWGDNILLVV